MSGPYDFAKAHPKDPRARPPGYSPRYQVDELQLASLLLAFNAGAIALEDVIDRVNFDYQIPGVRNVPYVAQVTAAETPVLLIPANPKRVSFIMANISFGVAIAVFYSFGFPPLSTDQPFVGGNAWGIPFPTFPFVIGPKNGTISLDDIYITAAAVPAFTAFTALAYEGVLAADRKASQ